MGGGGTRFGCFFVGGGGDDGTTATVGFAVLMGFMPPDSGFMPAFAAGLADLAGLAGAFAFGAGFLVGFLEGTRVFVGWG